MPYTLKPVLNRPIPRSGVDPGARRAMWTLLQQEVMGHGPALILTSHSMVRGRCRGGGLVLCWRAARSAEQPQGNQGWSW